MLYLHHYNSNDLMLNRVPKCNNIIVYGIGGEEQIPGSLQGKNRQRTKWRHHNVSIQRIIVTIICLRQSVYKVNVIITAHCCQYGITVCRVKKIQSF